MQAQNTSRQLFSTPYYVGVERRVDRRRSTEAKFEKMLKMFGIDRRDRPERRSNDSSWLLISADEDTLQVGQEIDL